MKTRALLLTLLTAVLSITALAQAPTRAQLQKINARYLWESGGFSNVSYLPLDTAAGAEVGAKAYKNGIEYTKDTLRWRPTASGGTFVGDNMANKNLDLAGNRTHNGKGYYFKLDTLAYLQYMIYRNDPFLNNIFTTSFLLDSTISGMPYSIVSALRNSSNTSDSIHTQLSANQNGAVIYNYGLNGNRYGLWEFNGNVSNPNMYVQLFNGVNQSNFTFANTTSLLPADSFRIKLPAVSNAPKMLGLRSQSGDIYTPVAIDMGNFITGLHGDITATGPGDALATLPNTGVVPGTYTNLNATIDAKGRILTATNGIAGVSPSDTANKWINDIKRSNDSVYAFKNGTWQFKYIDSTGGGSGISGLTAGRVTLSTSGTTVGDDGGLTFNSTSNEITTDSAILKKGKIDTVRVQVVNESIFKKAYFFGTSITHGYYTQDAASALDTARRWSAYVCRSQNWDEVNYGVAAMVMQDRAPSATNFLDDRMSFVPTFDASRDTALFYEFGINDATKTGQGLTNYNTTNFITDYSTAIDNATGKGWPTNRIYIIASNWVDPSLNSANSQATQDAYYVATKTVATNKSVNLIDLYYYSYANRNHFFYSDGLHPSNTGHSDYSIKILDALNTTVYKDAQTIAANGVTELETVKIKGSDTADIYYRPVALNQSNKMVNLPNGYWIENGPPFAQQAKINIRGGIDVTGTDGIDGYVRGKMLRATGARASVGVGAGWEFFYDGSTSQLYSFDQGAVAWRPIAINSSTYQWNTQGNAAFGFGLDNQAQVLSTGNKDGIHFNAFSNSNGGSSASTVLQVGPSGSMGDGIMLRYNGSGFTTNGAYEQATSIIDAGPNVANGLNIIASHSSAGVKWFTGGFATGNERMRLTSGGSLLINRTSLIGTEKLSINGKINALADSTASPINMLWMDTNGEIKKAAVPSGGGSDGNGIYSANGTLAGNRHVSGGASGNSLSLDSMASISLFSGLEFISSGIGSSIQMSDSVMNIGSSSATDFTSFTFSPTRIKFTAADGAGSTGDVWTNTGSGYGHWAAPSGSWSPTLTADANVDGTPTALHATYTRLGNIVTCYVTVSVDPTLITTQTEVGIPLPVASNFTNANDVSGAGAGSVGNGLAAFVQVSANTTSDRATLIFQSGSTSASIVTLSFQYTIL
jgi:lysophospholipase L1-like esterase